MSWSIFKIHFHIIQFLKIMGNRHHYSDYPLQAISPLPGIAIHHHSRALPEESGNMPSRFPQVIPGKTFGASYVYAFLADLVDRLK
jgi:hypothetical protein